MRYQAALHSDPAGQALKERRGPGYISTAPAGSKSGRRPPPRFYGRGSAAVDGAPQAVAQAGELAGNRPNLAQLLVVAGAEQRELF